MNAPRVISLIMAHYNQYKCVLVMVQGESCGTTKPFTHKKQRKGKKKQANKTPLHHWRFTDLLVCDYVKKINKISLKTQVRTYQKHILGLVVTSYTNVLCKGLLGERLEILTFLSRGELTGRH